MHPIGIGHKGNFIVANETPENSEALGRAGILYRKNDAADLTYWLQEITVHPEKYFELKKAALERAHSVYPWDSVIDQYEQLLAKLLREKQNSEVRSQNSK